MWKTLAKHKIIVTLVILAAAGGGYWYYKSSSTTKTETKYVLSAVTKGTVVTSVSGTGQVSSSNQVDVKPKVSGDITFVGIQAGQQVKTGDVMARIESRDAQKAVRDATTSLETARLSLAKLQQPLDALSETQAEDSLSAAERSLAQAQENLTQIQLTSAQTVATANDDGYNSVSSAFLDMPNHMRDLKDLRGTDAEPDANVQDFKVILGDNSPLIDIWLRDHDAALTSFNDTFAYFKTVTRSADAATLYDLISRTLVTETKVSQALLSAHAMLDACVNTSYKQYTIAATIDSSRTKISSDISQINGDLSSTQKAKDTLDTNARNLPQDLKKAQDAVEAAKENVTERTQSLAKLQAGVDPLDLRSQTLAVQDRQNALSDATEKLADYTIRAPFDGVIASTTVKKGDAASSGTIIATLITTQSIAKVSLNEVDASKVKVGQKATLTFDAIDGLTVTGHVMAIDAIGTVSQGVVTYDVTIGLDSQDDRIKPGMSVSAAIITDAKLDVLSVPNAAIKTQGGSAYVETIDGVTAPTSAAGITSATAPRRIMVETGLANDEVTEITSGLKEGDLIITRTITATAAGTAAAATQSRSILQTVGGGGAGGNARFTGGAGGGFRGGN